MTCAYPGPSESLGGDGGSGLVEDVWAFFLPKENVLPPALNPRGLDPGIAGKGILWVSLECGLCRSSRGVSVDDGSVEDELYRADNDELS